MDSPPWEHREGKAPVDQPHVQLSSRVSQSAPLSQDALNALRKDTKEQCKIQMERVKRPAIFHAYHDVDENIDDIVSQYVQIMRDENLKMANQINNPRYLKNAMQKAMATMAELSMVVMSQSKMHKEVEKYTVDSVAFSAHNLKQMEHRLEEAKNQSQYYCAQLLQEELKIKVEAQK